MNKFKASYHLTALAALWLTLAPTAQAQLFKIQSSSVEFIPTPPDQGAPEGRQRGGASRGDCSAHEDLAAIVPQVNGVVWSQTASATPTFFFDVPAELTAATPLELIIQDNNDEYVFRRQFTAEAAAGLLAVPAIPTAPEQSGLALGKAYSWTFSIYCDIARPSDSVSVSGTVQRVANPVSNSIETPETPLTEAEQFEQLQQYAAEGIWHEAVEIAILLHQADPDNVTYLDALESLLEQAGITETLPPVAFRDSAAL